jgi:hypothetical protein
LPRLRRLRGRSAPLFHQREGACWCKRKMLRGRILFVLALLAGATLALVVGVLRSANTQVVQTSRQAEAIKKTLESIKLPPDFKIGLYALVPGARAMAVGPQGKVIFVGTMGTEVYALTASLDPASPPKVMEFAGSIRKKYPHGVCFSRNGDLFVVEQNRVLSFASAETNYQDAAITPATVVPQGELIPTRDESSGHRARVCRVGPDSKLYIALGEPYNVPPHGKMPEF